MLIYNLRCSLSIWIIPVRKWIVFPRKVGWFVHILWISMNFMNTLFAWLSIFSTHQHICNSHIVFSTNMISSLRSCRNNRLQIVWAHRGHRIDIEIEINTELLCSLIIINFHFVSWEKRSSCSMPLIWCPIERWSSYSQFVSAGIELLVTYLWFNDTTFGNLR